MSNRRNNNSIFKNERAIPNAFNLLLILTLLLGISLACSREKEATRLPSKFAAETEIIDQPRKIEGYEVRGVKFAYYLIPRNLNHEQLIAAAQAIHRQEPETQLILVDDEAELAEYVAYAKQISLGGSGAHMPKKWADEHIIGNVQKYLSGKWVLCEGYGYREIAELK